MTHPTSDLSEVRARERERDELMVLANRGIGFLTSHGGPAGDKLKNIAGTFDKVLNLLAETETALTRLDAAEAALTRIAAMKTPSELEASEMPLFNVAFAQVVLLARSALASPSTAGTGWLGVEEHDGSDAPVLLWVSDEVGPFVGRWQPAWSSRTPGHWTSRPGGYVIKATKFRPLPPAPTTQEKPND